VIVLTHDGRRFQTNRAITQRRTLRTAGYDANVLGHDLSAPREEFQNQRREAPGQVGTSSVFRT
jgi:hypothetical protein